MPKAAAATVQENNGLVVFRHGSGLRLRRGRETPAHEIHPTSVRRPNHHLQAIQPHAWPAWAERAGSREAARVHSKPHFEFEENRKGILIPGSIQPYLLG